MENEVVVSKKGQTTIPARLGKRFNIEEGTKLEAVETDEAFFSGLRRHPVIIHSLLSLKRQKSC